MNLAQDNISASVGCLKFGIDTEFDCEILIQYCSDQMLRRGLSPSGYNHKQKMLAE